MRERILSSCDILLVYKMKCEMNMFWKFSVKTTLNVHDGSVTWKNQSQENMVTKTNTKSHVHMHIEHERRAKRQRKTEVRGKKDKDSESKFDT